MKAKLLIAVMAIGAAAGAALKLGLVDTEAVKARLTLEPAPAATVASAQAPAVTVAEARTEDFVETVLVTGSLVAREEILVAPEVDGLKVLDIKADIGDRVKQGDVLAVLVAETLDAQIAQSDATLARADAAIARAKSQIVESEARDTEADAQLARAKPLVKSDYVSESVYDQREAAARTAKAQLAAAREGLKLAEAEKSQAIAQRREIDWRRGNTFVRAPAAGIVSQRNARIGSVAASAGEPMFRIIADAEIELDAEIPDTRIPKVAVGQIARVETAGAAAAEGKVRLISPAVDPVTRLGRVRIFLGDNPSLKIGAFARATVETAKSRGLAVPQSAVSYRDDGAYVLAVVNNQAKLTRVETGLLANGMTEIRSGLAAGDLVVAKAGTFLRDGDAVNPIAAVRAVSEVR